MQVFKLNATHNPSDSVNDFETLVWTERYQEAGDFKLEVKNDISILTALPKGCLISHTDTREVMIVENHEIKRDSDKNLKVTLSGRSFETFAENRPTAGSFLALYDSGTGDANVETTAVLSSCHISAALLQGCLVDGVAPAADVIPDLTVDEVMRVHDTAMAQVIKRGHVYGRVLEFLQLSKAGLRTTRPIGATDMVLSVHDGIDRTATIVFYAQFEDLEDAEYFTSIKNYKNYARIAAHTYARLYRHRDIGSDLTGLNRRVMYIEADDIEGDYTPGTASDVISARAQSGLDERKEISLIQAKISLTAKPKFKIDYDVGDLVKVFGEFSAPQTMRVTEHILTADKDGVKGYPALSVV
jgi:hypothetical protein